jgi:hypothetical protein
MYLSLLTVSAAVLPSLHTLDSTLPSTILIAMSSTFDPQNLDDLLGPDDVEFEDLVLSLAFECLDDTLYLLYRKEAKGSITPMPSPASPALTHSG